MKNIIFMQDIDTNRKSDEGSFTHAISFTKDGKMVGHEKPNEGVGDTAVSLPQIHGRIWPGGISPYKYSIESWKRWAEKNNAEVIVMEDLLCPTTDMGIAWQRHYVIEMI